MDEQLRQCPKCLEFKSNSEFFSRSKVVKCNPCRAEFLIQESERRINSVEYQQKYHVNSKGFVYVIYSPTGIYKIGRSRNIDDRLKSFSVPGLEIYHFFFTYHSPIHEKMLHEIFKHKHVKGEWFALNADELEQLKKIGERVGRLKQDHDYITRADDVRLIQEINAQMKAEQRARFEKRRDRRFRRNGG